QTRRVVWVGAAWPTGSKRYRGGRSWRAHRVEERTLWPSSRSAGPAPRLENIGCREPTGCVAPEGEHVPIEITRGGESLPSVFSRGEVKGDRLPVQGVGTRGCGVVEVVSLGEGDTPAGEGEGEVAPVLVVDLGGVCQQRRAGELLAGEAGPIDPVERGCLL